MVSKENNNLNIERTMHMAKDSEHYKLKERKQKQLYHELLAQLPPCARDYLRDKDLTTQVSTRISYAYDLLTFFRYIKNVNPIYKETEINRFDYEDLKEHEPGFMEESEWLQYCLNENAFHSLKDFLDGAITGNQFDRERQLRAFSKINADTEGRCGERVHRFVKSSGR